MYYEVKKHDLGWFVVGPSENGAWILSEEQATDLAIKLNRAYEKGYEDGIASIDLLNLR